MPVELGQVVDGIVTGITDFGAFIQLPDGKTGLCHISEIADEYVKSVKDYLKDKQTVKVKVIEINGKGKVSLSIRKANENSEKKAEDSKKMSSSNGIRQSNPAQSSRPSSSTSRPPSTSRPSRPSSTSRPSRPSSTSRPTRTSKPGGGFEDMLTDYLKDSDEKLKDFKKNINKRRGNGFNRKES